VPDEGVYVYAISRGGVEHPPRGVGDAPVRAVEQGGLVALVSTVGLADFGEEGLRNHLEDLAWLEATARAHHTVIDTAAAAAPTLPLRLATVYRSEKRVREVLEERGGEFAGALDRIAGRTEWGVKGHADLTEFATGAAAGQDAAGASPGTTYLRRRQAERHDEEHARRAAAACAERIDAELGGIATARRLHPPQDPQLSGHGGVMILNASYLVDDESAEEFRTAVARLAERHPGIGLELTGPWAPYSFATGEEEP
jgi:Gas vesicle synthesis protein GvpL/GvpF